MNDQGKSDQATKSDQAIEYLKNQHGSNGQYNPMHGLGYDEDFSSESEGPWTAHWLYPDGQLSDDFGDGHETSAYAALQSAGYPVGEQPQGENRFHDIYRNRLQNETGVVRVGSANDDAVTFVSVGNHLSNAQLSHIKHIADEAKHAGHRLMWDVVSPDNKRSSGYDFDALRRDPLLQGLSGHESVASVALLGRRFSAFAEKCDRHGFPRFADRADAAIVRLAQMAAQSPQIMTQPPTAQGGQAGQLTPQQMATVIGQMQSYLTQLQKQVQNFTSGSQPQTKNLNSQLDPLTAQTGPMNNTGMAMGQQNNVTVPDNNMDTNVNVDTGI